MFAAISKCWILMGESNWETPCLHWVRKAVWDKDNIEKDNADL